MAGTVKGVAGGVSPDKLSSCQTGGVNLSAVAAVPDRTLLCFTFLFSSNGKYLFNF